MASAPLNEDIKDKSVLAAHIHFMISELKRRSPDLRKLGDSMKKTRLSQRMWITSTNPSAAEALEKYPALTIAEIVSMKCKIVYLLPTIMPECAVYTNSIKEVYFF